MIPFDGTSFFYLSPTTVYVGIVLALLFMIINLFCPPSPHPVLASAREVALVIAHPDDEVMFFYPYLYNAPPSSVSVLCLSTGNADGLGKIREMELRTSCDRIRSIKACSVVDHPELQDGMDQKWPPHVVAQEVGTFVEAHDNIQTILTFDHLGVSFHPNHIAVSTGVKHYALEREKKRTTRQQSVADSTKSSKKDRKKMEEEKHEKRGTKNDAADDDIGVTVVMLKTTAWIRKFIGPFDILLTPMLALAQPRRAGGHSSEDERTNEGVYISGNPLRCLRALTAHWSQMVWFRWLWCFFSRYSTVNSFYAL